jgi:hypothetical protein
MFNRKAHALLGAAALLGLGAPALAQSAGGFDKPLKSGGGSAQGGATARAQGTGQGGRNHIAISKSEDGDSYAVEIDGDQVTAKVNGKEVPRDRIRRTGDTLEILDKDGDVLTSFQVSKAGEGFHVQGKNLVINGQGGATLFTPGEGWGQNGQGGAFGGTVAQGGKPPRVMLGITMTDSDDEDGQGVVLGSVSEGLPAAKAGLKKGDVVVSFDGQKVQNTTKVRELLAKKQPGDKAKIVVLRKGDEKTYTVELQPFNQAALASPQAREEALAAAQAHRAVGQAHEEARREMERAMKEMEKSGLTGKAHEEAMQKMQEYMKGMEDGNGNPRAFVWGPGGQQFQMLTPAGPEMKERLSSLDKKLSELDEKVARLDQQLDRLEKKLDRLNERGR